MNSSQPLTAMHCRRVDSRADDAVGDDACAGGALREFLDVVA